MRRLFVHLSFIMRLLSLRRYVSSIYMYILHGSVDDYITLSSGTKLYITIES